jgi:hypothetical protein
MKIVADTHTHIYPCYDVTVAFRNLTQNLGKYSKSAIKTALLTERSDCHFFSELCRDKGQLLQSEFDVLITNQNESIIFTKDEKPCLYLFPGRQIVTSERIEILSLISDQELDNGLDANTVIQRIIDAGGVPVISWAPGKWFFKRKKIVEKIINRWSPQQILLGDTSLRPRIWGKPLLMKSAEKTGFKILAGSDPLPFEGEEAQLGLYGSFIHGDIDMRDPAESMRSLLIDPDIGITNFGKRNTLVNVLIRLFKNARTKECFD